MPDVIELPRYVVKAKRETGDSPSTLRLKIETMRSTLTWNPTAGTYEVSTIEPEVRITEEGEQIVQDETVTMEKFVVEVTTSATYVLDGYIMQDWHYTYNDGSVYTTTLRRGLASDLYATDGGIRRVSYDESKTWQSFDGEIPRAAPTYSSGGSKHEL